MPVQPTHYHIRSERIPQPAPRPPPPPVQPAAGVVENCHANSLYQHGPTCALATIMQLTLRTPLIVFFDQQSPAGTFLRETERMFMHINPGSFYCPLIPNQLLSERSQLRNNTFTDEGEGLNSFFLLLDLLRLSGARCRFLKKSPESPGGYIDNTTWAGFETYQVSDFMLFNYDDPNSYITHKTGVRAPVDLIEKTLFSQVQHDAQGLANGMLYIGSELRLFKREGTGVHSHHSVVVFPCRRGNDRFILCNHWGDHNHGTRSEQDCRTLQEQLQGPFLKDYKLRGHYDYWVSRDVYRRWLKTVKGALVDLSEDDAPDGAPTAPVRSKITLKGTAGKYAKHNAST